MVKHIPCGIHVESMEYTHSIWNPYGMWGDGKVNHQDLGWLTIPQGGPAQTSLRSASPLFSISTFLYPCFTSSKTISSTRPLYILIILSFSQTKPSQMASVALKNTYPDQGWRNRLGSHQFCRHPRIWPCSISNRFHVMYKSPLRYPIVFCRHCCAYQHLQWPIWPIDSYLKIIFLVFHYNRNNNFSRQYC